MRLETATVVTRTVGRRSRKRKNLEQEMKELREYITEAFSSIDESVMKVRDADKDGFSHGPFFGMKALSDTGRWLDVDEIRVEDKDISGNPADKGMQYCTLVFGSLSKTKQISKVKKPKETAKENNWGYNWMPSPELLAEILKAFGSDKVSFDFNDKNLEGINWRKYGVYL